MIFRVARSTNALETFICQTLRTTHSTLKRFKEVVATSSNNFKEKNGKKHYSRLTKHFSKCYFLSWTLELSDIMQSSSIFHKPIRIPHFYSSWHQAIHFMHTLVLVQKISLFNSQPQPSHFNLASPFNGVLLITI
jgi:hypothetical protein